MILVPLTQGQFAAVDDFDYVRVMKHKWNASRSKKLWVVRRKIRKSDGTWKHQGLHHFILGTTARLDHKDGNGLNDQRWNLRPCTQAQNTQNKGATKHSSRFKGVRFHKASGKWQARICVNYKTLHLGSFENERDAADAYDAEALIQFGEFARTNKQMEVLGELGR